MARPAVIALVFAVLLAGAAAPASADPPARYAYDLQGTLESSVEGSTLALSGPDGGRIEPAFESVVIPGAPRAPWTAVRVAAGEHLQLGAPTSNVEAWTMAAVVRLDAVDGARRLARFGFSAGDTGLYVQDGRLTWRDGGPPQTGDSVLAPGGWHHLVLTRDATGELVVRLDGATELTVSDPSGLGRLDSLALFGDEHGGTEHGAGALARLRVWEGRLAEAEIAALDLLDGVPPSFDIREPAEGARVALRPAILGGGLTDDGTQRPAMTVHLRDEATGAVFPYPGFAFSLRAPEWGASWTGPDGLTDGRWYTASVTATDRAGNAAVRTRRFYADGSGPEFTVTEPGAVTDDETPIVAGVAGTRFGDQPFIRVVASRREAGGALTGFSEQRLDVVGGRFSTALEKPMPPGDYVLRLSQWDFVGQTTTVDRSVRILPAGRASAASLRRAALSRVRRARMRRLLRGRERVPFEAAVAGTATLRILRGTRAVFTGRRVVARGGRSSVAIKPTRHGRRALRRTRRARLVVQASYAARGGTGASRTARVTVRR